MQIIRTIIWVMILFGILTFSFLNWDTVEVNLWENLVLETKVPVLVITAFLLGLVPMWLYHRSVKWSLGRRIRSLEASIKSTALAQRHEPEATRDKTVEKPLESPVNTSANPEATLTPAQTTNGPTGGPKSGETPA